MLFRCFPFLAIALLMPLAAHPAGAAEPAGPIPQAARDRYAAGQDFEKDGKLKEAATAYEDAVRLGMQAYSRVYLREAAVYQRLGDYASAAVRYSVVIDVLGLEGSCRD